MLNSLSKWSSFGADVAQIYEEAKHKDFLVQQLRSGKALPTLWPKTLCLIQCLVLLNQTWKVPEPTPFEAIFRCSNKKISWCPKTSSFNPAAWSLSTSLSKMLADAGCEFLGLMIWMNQVKHMYATGGLLPDMRWLVILGDDVYINTARLFYFLAGVAAMSFKLLERFFSVFSIHCQVQYSLLWFIWMHSTTFAFIFKQLVLAGLLSTCKPGHASTDNHPVMFAHASRSRLIKIEWFASLLVQWGVNTCSWCWMFKLQKPGHGVSISWNIFCPAMATGLLLQSVALHM